MATTNNLNNTNKNVTREYKNKCCFYEGSSGIIITTGNNVIIHGNNR